MVLSLIDDEPIQEGWGRVYQSGVIASENWDEPGLIISMAGNENVRGPCLWVNMPDDEVNTLTDTILLAFADTAIAFLSRGQNVLVHCNEGKYRSTYMDVAIHMRAGLSFYSSYSLVKERHPIATLRDGTEAQLRRMESILKGG